jgi:hypothetical protein
MADRFQFGLRQLILVTISASIGIGIGIRNPDARWAVVALLVIGFLASVGVRHYPRTTIVLIVVVVFLAYRQSTIVRIDTRAARARSDLKNLVIMSGLYQTEFGRFPADSIADCRGTAFLSALMPDNTYSRNGPQRSLWGGAYSFVVINPGQPEAYCLIIDPGPDKLLGGTLDPQKGFVPDGSDANRDGIPDDKDNIRSDQLDY